MRFRVAWLVMRPLCVLRLHALWEVDNNGVVTGVQPVGPLPVV